MRRILFICAGNVARSQMAEAYYNHQTGSERASSAGVLDDSPARYGSPVSSVVEVMREDGIDLSSKRVKTVTLEMVQAADEIYVLCPEEEIPDFVVRSGKCECWDIPDPSNASLDGFRQVRDQVKANVERLLRAEQPN